LKVKQEGSRPSVICATWSIIAASTFHAVQARRLSIPADVFPVGFDGVGWVFVVRAAARSSINPIRTGQPIG